MVTQLATLPNKVLIFGIDNAGKSAIVMSIREGKTILDTMPTRGFDINNTVIRDLDFVLWDAPGQLIYRELWSKGTDCAKVMVFVVDTSDKSRFKEARDALDSVLSDDSSRGVPLVFCYHKIDLPKAQENLAEAKEIFQLSKIRSHKIFAFHTSVKDMPKLNKMKNTIVDIVCGVMF